MEKRIVIATPVDYSNFGNRLQNYAVHMVCKKYGMEPITLAVEYTYIKNKIPKHKLLEIVDALRMERAFSHISKLKNLNKSVAAWNFTKKEISTIYVRNEKGFKDILESAEYFGIGGDQVLAPYWHNIIWFATFQGQDPERKICFAPSFGSDQLPEEYLEHTIIPEFQAISFPAVREQSGCTMIKTHTGKDAFRICDPVVMLSKKDWNNSAIRHPVNQKSLYILVYFLGNASETYQQFIQDEARKNGYIVIDVSRNSFSNEAACDPMEFVSYIGKAECVYTDSFHAIMLSLILNRNVVIFERAGGEEMNTRINELVKRYQLSNCLFSVGLAEDDKAMLGAYNTTFVNRILHSERLAADEYYKQFK